MNIKKDIPGILESGDKWFRVWILRPFGAQDDDYAFTVVKLNASPSASLASRPSAVAAQAIFTA